MEDLLSSVSIVFIGFGIIVLAIVLLLAWVIAIDRRTRGMVDELEAERRKVAEMQTIIGRRNTGRGYGSSYVPARSTKGGAVADTQGAAFAPRRASFGDTVAGGQGDTTRSGSVRRSSLSGFGERAGKDTGAGTAGRSGRDSRDTEASVAEGFTADAASVSRYSDGVWTYGTYATSAERQTRTQGSRPFSGETFSVGAAASAQSGNAPLRPRSQTWQRHLQRQEQQQKLAASRSTRRRSDIAAKNEEAASVANQVDSSDASTQDTATDAEQERARERLRRQQRMEARRQAASQSRQYRRTRTSSQAQTQQSRVQQQQKQQQQQQIRMRPQQTSAQERQQAQQQRPQQTSAQERQQAQQQRPQIRQQAQVRQTRARMQSRTQVQEPSQSQIQPGDRKSVQAQVSVNFQDQSREYGGQATSSTSESLPSSSSLSGKIRNSRHARQ